MSGKGGSKSRRQVIRDKRRQQQRRQRLMLILGIVGIALLVTALLIAPSIQNALTPVGEVIQITPEGRPMVDGKTMGNPDAPVRIEVFEDFQCPSCKQYSESIESQVIDNYVANGDVYYVYRFFPFLDDQVAGNESNQAANASMCAAEQDRFWDYHDMLFANWNGENQGAFIDKRLVAFAEALNLDMDSFNSCFQANKYREVIQEDLNEGRSRGVQGTPSVFVNGQQLAPGFIPSYDQISQAVEAALASGG